MPRRARTAKAPRTCMPMPPAMGELVAGLRSGAAEREAAYSELHQLEAEHSLNNVLGESSSSGFADVAVACAPLLCEVLCKKTAEVDACQ